MGDQKGKILIMAGALALAIVVFVVVFLGAGKKEDSASSQPNGTTSAPTSTGAPATGAPGTPGAPATTAAGVPVPPPTPAGLLPPPPPPMLRPPTTAIAGTVADPFDNGPKPPAPKKIVVPPTPPRLRVASIPVFSPQPDRLRRGPTTSAKTVERPAPVGRHAGWIYNTASGQIVAIFEDRDGTARTLKVGDQIEDKTVKAITPDHLVLVDNGGQEERIRLQGLDAYQGKSRAVDVNASPNAPAWGGRTMN